MKDNEKIGFLAGLFGGWELFNRQENCVSVSDESLVDMYAREGRELDEKYPLIEIESDSEVPVIFEEQPEGIIKGVQRPQQWADFIGESNKSIVERLQIACCAARKQDRPVPHILLYGPGGLGKTTLAKIIANEMKYSLHEVTGSTITKQSDILSIIHEIQLKQQQGLKVLLFIDEIHDIAGRDAPETLWYPFLENFKFYHNLKDTNIILNGIKYRIAGTSVKVHPITIIGATTDPALLNAPLRGRFSLSGALKPYTPQDLQKIVLGYAERVKWNIDTTACLELAQRSRGVPRTVINFLIACQDRAIVLDEACINKAVSLIEMASQGIDSEGLTDQDIVVLQTLARTEKGLGLANLAGTCGLNKMTLEEMIEPLLKQRGYIIVSNRRRITPKGLSLLERKKK